MLLQTVESFGYSAKSQHGRSAGVTDRCALKMNMQKGVPGVLRDVLSKHMFCIIRRIFMYDVSGVVAMCCRHTFR